MAYFGIRNICSGGPPQTVAVSSSSSEVVAADTNRKGIWIQNTGNRTVFLGFGANAAEDNKGIRLVKDERIQVGATMLPTEAINAKTTAGPSTLIYQEFI